MCEVATMVAIGSVVVGTAVKAGAAAARGRAAASAYETDAALAERAAGDAIQRSMIPAMRARMHGSGVVAAQRVLYAASGVDVNVGGPETVQRETRVISDLDEKIIRNNAAREAYGYGAQAQRYHQEAAIARSEADNAVLSSVIGGVGNAAMVGSKSWLDLPNSSGGGEPAPPIFGAFSPGAA